MVAEAFHPWEFIAEELEERGWTKDDLAARMGDSYSSDVHRLALDIYEAVRDPDIDVRGSMAESLSLAFGTSAEFWVNLHEQWRTWAKAQASREDGGEK